MPLSRPASTTPPPAPRKQAGVAGQGEAAEPACAPDPPASQPRARPRMRPYDDQPPFPTGASDGQGRGPLSPSSRTQGQPRPHGRFSGRHGPRPPPPPRSDTSRASSQDSRPLKGGRTSSRPALLSPFPPGIPAQASLPSSQLALEAMGQLAPPPKQPVLSAPPPPTPAGPCCDAPGGPQLLWGRLCPRALSSETSWGGVAALQPQPHSAPPRAPHLMLPSGTQAPGPILSPVLSNPLSTSPSKGPGSVPCGGESGR